MNLNIKLLLFIFFINNAFANESFQNILRSTAIENGYQSPKSLIIEKDSELFEEGKAFFESKNLSFNKNIACATCHITRLGSSDALPNAAGIEGSGEGINRLLSGARIIPRNTLAMWGVGSKEFKRFFGMEELTLVEKIISQFGDSIPSKDPLISAVHLPVVELRETIDEDDFILAHKLESTKGADAVFDAITKKLTNKEPKAINSLANKLNKNLDEVEFLDIARSISAFIRKEFRIRESKFSTFMSGDTKVMNKNEINGGILFYGKGGCVVCHNGPYFTNFDFYTVPFAQIGFGKNGFGIDYGRYNVTFNPKDLYKFRTPVLWNVSNTPPYGHSGSAKTLKSAILYHFDPLTQIETDKLSSFSRYEYYKYLTKNDSINYVNYLNDQEVNDLVLFLRL